MTTISVPGKITALEVDESSDLSFTSLSGGTFAAPTAIMPDGSEVMVILVTATGSTPYLKLDSSFDIGDVVETYPAVSSGYQILDENGTAVGSSGGIGQRFRKLHSTPPAGLSTWGVV